MPAVQKTLRDAAIVAACHAGENVKDIATAYELTPRQVRRIFDAFKMRPSGLDHEPMEIIGKAIRLYEQQMASFAAVAENTIDRQPAVAVAALKGHADTLERYLSLLSDVGKLPENLEMFRQESEMLQIGRAMVEMSQKLAAGEISGVEVEDKLAALLYRRQVVGELETGEAA
jgi:hypothetical protein